MQTFLKLTVYDCSWFYTCFAGTFLFGFKNPFPILPWFFLCFMAILTLGIINLVSNYYFIHWWKAHNCMYIDQFPFFFSRFHQTNEYWASARSYPKVTFLPLFLQNEVWWIWTINLVPLPLLLSRLLSTIMWEALLRIVA